MHLTYQVVSYFQPSFPDPEGRMSRGNQRDIDRARAQKRTEKYSKDKNKDGLTPEQRRERDAKALAEKIAKKAASDGK